MSTLDSEVHHVKLYITLKQSDADGLGGELLNTLGMDRARRDPKTFVKELAVTELLDRFTKSFEDDGDGAEEDAEEDDGEKEVKAGTGAFTGRRRRRRRRVRPTDFLLYEDNSLYALPYLEPLTDRGVIPLRVSLRTDSTVSLTPINASVVSADPVTTLNKHDHGKALRELDEGIARAKKAGHFKSISHEGKESLMHEIADRLGEEDPEAIRKFVDNALAKKLSSSADEDAALAAAALELAQSALKSGSNSPAVISALRAAAEALKVEDICTR